MTTVEFWFYSPFDGARVEWTERFRFRWYARYVAFATNISPRSGVYVHARISA